MHGYGISRWINDRSDGALAVEDAALYQALHRLERKGLVASEWGVSEKNHRAKYYNLTPAGRRQLQTEVAELRQYMAVLFRVLDPA
jgi:DNA-binding PadR family transcriptional regulator